MKIVKYTVTMDMDWVMGAVYGRGGSILFDMSAYDGAYELIKQDEIGTIRLSSESTLRAAVVITLKFGDPSEIERSKMRAEKRKILDATESILAAMMPPWNFGNEASIASTRAALYATLPHSPVTVYSVIVADFGGDPAQIDFDLEFVS